MLQVLPADRSHTWGLRIKNVTTTDTGAYLCQVNTEPRITLPFHLTVKGQSIEHLWLNELLDHATFARGETDDSTEGMI